MLCVYDKFTKQDDFRGAGVALLRPQRMHTKEVINGEYSVNLAYHMDSKDTAWRYLQPYNIIRNSEDQLFFIHTLDTYWDAGRQMIEVQAKHISYYLADKIMFQCVYNNVTAGEALQRIKDKTHITWMPAEDSGYVEYDFSYSSDISERRNINYDSINPIAAILGASDSIVNTFGGEIHRDNFRISVNRRKEGAVDNAFKLTHGFNLLSVHEHISVDNVCTAAYGTSNFHSGGFTIGQAYAVRAPHEIIRNLKFSYKDISYLEEDTTRYYREDSELIASYEAEFKDFRNIPKYEKWAQLQQYSIGSTGTIYSERLGIETQQKIVERVKNDITGETEKIVLATQMPSLYKYNRYDSMLARNDSPGKRLDAIEAIINRINVEEG